MTREEVWKAVADAIRPQFGQLLEVRDVRRVRRVVGDGWVASVVLVASSEEVHVADLNVDDAGGITPRLTAEHFLEAIRRPKLGASQIPEELMGFGEEDTEPGEDDFGLIDELGGVGDSTQPSLEARIEQAMLKGDAASLQVARELLPRLLTDHDRQGETLFRMAKVELGLGHATLARGYLEAAAREFADRFDLPALERAAALALEQGGRETFAGSPIHTLLESSRGRLTPLENVFEARSLNELPVSVRVQLLPHVTLRTLAPDEVLVQEGEPSRNVFVVKSGLVGVWLEKPEGGSWLVRCCFPGWLLGESSVLDAARARCTATLRAERVSEVWCIPGEVMRAAMEADPELRARIAQTKQTHRIDSFFSMHETMNQLDVQVRDEVLSCIVRLETFEEETVVLLANQIPEVACLVARGGIRLFEEGAVEKPAAVIEPDCFYGVRDAIHRIAAPFNAVVVAGSTVAFFDAKRLQKLCERSPEQVVAVLERLG